MSRLQIEGQPARYRGVALTTAKVWIGGHWFDLGLGDTTRAVEVDGAKAILRNLYDRAGTEPEGVDAFLEEVTELVARCKEFTRWKEPPKRDRKFGKRRNWSPNWRSM